MPFTRFLRPRSIAVFGGREAEEVIRQCDRMGYDGEIWPVHPKKREILGRKVYRDIQDLPRSPDASYIAVNRHLTIQIVRELAEAGAGGATCFATGFSESGDEGEILEKALLEASGDMPLLGPNCYGMINYIDRAILWPDQHGGRQVENGVAIVTMSSNIAINLTMQQRGLPIAYVASLGNKMKFDLPDAIRVFAQQDRVTAIGLYIEGIEDPVAFDQAMRVARDLGKPVVAIKAGRSEAAQKMALSHTASLTGSDELMNVLFERTGVARVNSLEALIEALKVVHVAGPLEGYRVSAMSPSGGDGSLVADAMEGMTLVMPPLSTAGEQRIRPTVHERVTVSNPFDYQLFDWDSEERLTDTFSAFVAEDFDMSMCLLDYPREDRCDLSTWGPAERAIIEATRRTKANTAVLSTFTDNFPESVAERLMSEGIVPLAGIDAGLAGIQAAADIGTVWQRPPPLPLLKAPTFSQECETEILDEAASKRLLARYGVPVPLSKIVSNAKDAASVAEGLGFPVVVKALGVAHKTDVGGVRLNLQNGEEVSAAVTDMKDLSDQYLIEKMVDGVVAELIVGVVRDEQFGPYLVLGAGGVLVELMQDSQSLLLPVTKEKIMESLESLKCAPLFHGFRGRPNADLDAAAEAILGIAHFAQENAASIVELDVNPLMLRAEGQGVIAADALICMNVDG